jgi:putative membrane protein
VTSGEAARPPARRETTDLANARTALAAERTLMAWIRTSLAMISFGFTIFEFLHGLQQAAAIDLRRPQGPRQIGLFLTILGTGSLVAGLAQYMRALHRLHGRAARLGVAFYVACAVVLLGLGVLIGLLSRVGPF